MKSYPEQRAAAKAAAKYGRGIIVAPTGVGKSRIIALIINELQVNTLVVVPTLELKRQLTETLKEAFGAKMVGSYQRGYPIAVENVDALDPKQVDRNYDCVIIDEFHHSAAKTYRSLNKHAWGNVFYRFGMTATPFRSQDHERLLLESVLSQVIYELPYQKAVHRGYIVPMEAYFIELPKRDVEGYTWKQVYNELVVNNEARNEQIALLLNRLRLTGTSTLCLVKEIAHGEAIQDFFEPGVMHFAKGENEDNAAKIAEFNEGQFPVLIGTTGILGEGVDTRPAEFVIVAGLGKSKNAFMQQCGRGFRRHPGKESCKVILFYDPSHKFTKRHFAAQLKILKDEYGVKAVRLNLDYPSS